MAKRFFLRGLPWIVLVHAGLLLIFWLTNALFYADTNAYLTDMLGARRDYVSLSLIATGGLALWSIARLVLARLGRSHRLAALTGILYGLYSLVFIAFFYGSYWLLFQESPSQLPRIQQLILYYRIIFDILFLFAAVFLGARWLRRALLLHPAQSQNERLRRAAPIFGLLALIWLLALIFPPGSVYRGALPKKPLLIAHRGASFLAPENTLASAELAASLGVFGLETDLHLSKDGIPYLMHDDTLARTTDVAAVFPGREKERAEQFTLAEVRQLNAGQWFLDRDPYRTIASRLVSSNQAQTYQSLVVPTLDEELEIVRNSQAILIFDMKQPPEGHPFNKQFFDLVFNQILAAGIDPQIWFLANPEQASLIRDKAPQITLVYGADYRHPTPPEELISNGYPIVEADFGLASRWIRLYKNAGLWVNLYTVDEAWQFSRLWLMGVDSITSSNVASLLALQRPVFSLPFSTYLILWVFLGIIASSILYILARPFKTL